MGTHKVTFNPQGTIVEVDPESYPFGREGKGGSLLDIALTHGVHIEHGCGGTGVCGTCHVLVEGNMENLSEADDDELDTLNRVIGSAPNSRIACQAVVRGDVTVTIREPR